MAPHRTDVRVRRVATRPRPRYKRIGAAGGSLLVTAIAILGGVGILPTTQAGSAAYASNAVSDRPTTSTADGTAQLSGSVTSSHPTEKRRSPQQATPGKTQKAVVPSVPASSGSGKRVVFDMTTQRVWLVNAAEKVTRSYLVSGSVTDNLKPGSYAVYSRSLHAWGFDDSGTMEYMVRFTQGDNAAIGFHDIPVKDGKKLQTRAELGTPRSHGCIRQWRPDAKALWEFAPIGTPVIVTT